MERGIVISLGLVFVACIVSGSVNAVEYGNNYFQQIARNLIRNGFPSNFSYELVDHILTLYIPASNAVENQSCRRDSQQLKDAIKRNKHWALQMLDASSKFPSGLYIDNTGQLGNYDECLNVREKSLNFTGQHCIVHTHLDAHDLEDSNHTTIPEYDDNAMWESAFALGTKWSVCIPSSCTPRDLQAHLRSVLAATVGGVSVTVEDNGCRSRAHRTVLTPADWFAVALFSVFAVLVVLSTGYDLRNKNAASRSNLLLAFSVYTNGRKMLSVSPGGDELKALHAIRTLSMLWMLVGHTYGITVYLPSINTEPFIKITENWQHAFLFNYSLGVDSFLLLSGLLLCYGFLKKVKRELSFNVPLFYLHRYVRLTPAYAAMILLSATLLAYTGDGPLWEKYLIESRQTCTEHWWTNLIYLNNILYPYNTCVVQSWYLSLDMQLYVMSPLLIYPLWRWKKFGMILLGLLIFTGLVIAFLIAFIYEPNNPYTSADSYVLEYLPPHTRFTPWVLGVALGYLLHSYRNKTLHLPLAAVVLGWMSCCLLLILPVAANHSLEHLGHSYNRWEYAFNSGLNRPAFALGVAWIIFACNHGYGGIVNSFFSWKMFTLISRLTYCTYLVHYAVILWTAGSTRTPLYFSDTRIVLTAFNVTVISFVAALLLALVFEAPALNIEKILLDRVVLKEDKKNKYAVEEGNKDNTTQQHLMEIL